MPLNTKNVDDLRVRIVREQVTTARNKLKLAEKERNELVKTMHSEGSSIEYLATQFALTEQKIKYLLSF